jgi:hypothetical protein
MGKARVWLGVLVLAGLGMLLSLKWLGHQALLCGRCHEMQAAYSTWRVSSHKDLPCERCHGRHSLGYMLRSKLAHGRPAPEKAGVVQERCRACHTETREMVVYHSLKITHRQHWDLGVGCLFCHNEVVHGPRAAYKNTPKMATCYKCHDGKKASNACSTCHATLGERKPAAFSLEWIEAHKEDVRQHSSPAASSADSAGKKRTTCTRCHSDDFCQNCHSSARPHGGNWLAQHPAAAKVDQTNCQVCHQTSFCNECHNIRRAHSLNWLSEHHTEAHQKREECRQCHEDTFCHDCHTKFEQHSPDWLFVHPLTASRSKESCRRCHPSNFCENCHTKQVPQSHKGPWLDQHKNEVNRGNGTCSTCHKSDFCIACHRSRRPASHDEKWIENHGKRARQSGRAQGTAPTACLTCHEAKKCTECHGVPVPHPSTWRADHRREAAAEAALCARCHPAQECRACHKSRKPRSHGRGWSATHGQQDARRCVLCHEDAFCLKCHGLPMPHPSNWTSAHQQTALQKGNVCFRCHQRTECVACHTRGGPASHTAAWSRQHAAVGRKNPALCALCHGANSCQTCHQANPHPSGWVMQHGAKASFAANSSCWGCHARNYCSRCHEAAEGEGRGEKGQLDN